MAPSETFADREVGDERTRMYPQRVSEGAIAPLPVLFTLFQSTRSTLSSEQSPSPHHYGNPTRQSPPRSFYPT